MTTSGDFPAPTPPPPPSSIGPNSMDPARLRSLHRPLKWLAVGSAVTSLFEMVALANRYYMIRSITNGTFTGSSSTIENSDELVMVSAVTGVLLLVALMIYLMVWANRTTKFLNSHHVSTRRSSGKAVGIFFIPIANFFMVYGLLKDLTSGLGRIFPRVTYQRYLPLRTFWILLVLGNVSARYSYTPSDEDWTFDLYQTFEFFQFASAALVLGAAVSAFRAFGQMLEDVS